MKFQPLKESHLRSIAQVHLDAFPAFFLSSLGMRFLCEFYRAFLLDPSAVAIVAVNEGGTICGVAVGTVMPNGFFRRLLIRRWWAFCLASTSALLRKPAIASRLLAGVSYRGDSRVADDQRALLSSIAIAPDSQGRGVGSNLANEWLAEVRRRGSVGCYLLTDARANDRVNSFYVKLGWKLAEQYLTPRGRLMNRLVLDFAPQE